MDLKRVVLAIALSMIVLGVWTYFFQPQYTPPPQQAKPQTEESAPSAAPGTVGLESAPAAPSSTVELGQSAAAPQAGAPLQAGRSLNVSTPLYHAVINTAGGILEAFELHGFKATIEPDSPDVNLISPKAVQTRPLQLILGGTPQWDPFTGGDLTLQEGGTQSLTLTGTLGDVRITRELSFDAATYLIKDKVTIHNSGENRIKGSLGFSINTTTLTAEGNDYNPTSVAALSASGRDEENSVKTLRKEWFVRDFNVKWGALQSNYFILAMLPPLGQPDDMQPVFRARLQDDIYHLVLDQPLGALDPGREQTYECTYFMGPKQQALLEQAPNELALAVDMGWFDFIAKPLLVGLNFIDKYVGNYGISIIILTFFIKLLLWPLSQKSYKSMEQLKKLQPMMTKIREKHKDDRQKMNEEMMQLYKTYKVNPAGGCLPMLLQIPVFIGLYQALLNSLELRHAAFITYLPFTDIIWLADLSVKDPFYITPIIMGATMFLQQKMTPAPGDPTQAKIMLFMPIFFTFIFLNFPAGLVVYWLTNNVLSIAQQWWMLRKS